MGPAKTENGAVLVLNSPTPVASKSELDAKKLIYAKKISMRNRFDENEAIACSEICFWSSKSTKTEEEKESENVPDLVVKVKYPGQWSEQVYLAVLYITIKRNEGIMVDSITQEYGVVQAPFETLNYVHYMYSSALDEVLELIDTNKALAKVM